MKAKFPGIELLSRINTRAATRDTAKRASENMLNRFGDEVQGIFTPNESSTAGMLLALQDIGKAGKVSFVGFDSSQTLSMRSTLTSYTASSSRIHSTWVTWACARWLIVYWANRSRKRSTRA
jgi:DNA-binding LacI/PurR family transcriptional regulator